MSDRAATAALPMEAEAEFVRRATEGDHEAFRSLYDLYVARIYDYCFSQLRNRDDAQDVTSDVFLKAIERVGELKPPYHFRGWIYAIAHNFCMDALRRRSKVVSLDVVAEPESERPGPDAVIRQLPSSAPDPVEQVEEAELVTAVWEAAATLDSRTYSVFDLLVRQELSSGEIAQALGVSSGHAYVLVSRCKDSVEEALAAVVLARAGRRDCAVLDGIVTRYGDERTPRIRKAISRHMRDCEKCDQTRRRVATPMALLRGVPAFVPAPAFTRRLRGRLRPPPRPREQAPRARRRLRSPRSRLFALLLSVVLVGTAVTVLARRAVDDAPDRVRDTPSRETPAVSAGPLLGAGDVASDSPPAPASAIALATASPTPRSRARSSSGTAAAATTGASSVVAETVPSPTPTPAPSPTPTPTPTPGGTISTGAGSGTAGSAGDGGLATSAQLNQPHDVAIAGDGSIYIADNANNKVRKVTFSSPGTITTIVGTGAAGSGGDGGPATSAQLSVPAGVALDSSGNLYIADLGNHRVRKVTPSGTISTIAGTGTAGSAGDGGAATSAQLNEPFDVVAAPDGSVYVSEFSGHRVRRIAPSGTISTVAGTGTEGFSGEGGPATSAQLGNPAGLALDGSGALYIGEYGNHRVRKVASGTIITVAGAGTPGYSGDGGTATSAQLNQPKGVAVDAAGVLYIGDRSNHRVRKVQVGEITTVAGTGTAGYSGDGGSAASAQLNTPVLVALDPTGATLYVADSMNHRIRQITL